MGRQENRQRELALDLTDDTPGRPLAFRMIGWIRRWFGDAEFRFAVNNRHPYTGLVVILGPLVFVLSLVVGLAYGRDEFRLGHTLRESLNATAIGLGFGLSLQFVRQRVIRAQRRQR